MSRIGSLFFTEAEAGASFAALWPRPSRVTFVLERTVAVLELELLRDVVAVLLPEERLVVAVPLERLVRLF